MSGGNGEGQSYIGSTSVTTDGTTGDVSFTFHPTATLNVGSVITATATSTGGLFSTSEFSACAAVLDGSPEAVTFQFTSATYTVAENVASHLAAITLTRIGGTNGSISTTFTTSDGTANAGSDYTDSDQTVTFNEGETTKTINVPIIDDATAEANETVNLALSHPPIINAPMTGGASAPLPSIYAAVLTITNDDCPTVFMVNSNGDGDDVTQGDGVCATSGAVCTLRAAIQEANASLASCGAINITFSGVVSPITLGSPLPAIAHSVNISGPGANLLSVSGNNSFPVFEVNVASPKVVAISGLTIANGNSGSSNGGGGIRNSGSGTVNVDNSAVSNNSAPAAVGGIFNVSGTVNITNSILNNNAAPANLGGGIFNQGGIVNDDCTLSTNSAVGGGDYNQGTATVNITNSTISRNIATGAGGIFNSGAAVTIRKQHRRAQHR